MLRVDWGRKGTATEFKKYFVKGRTSNCCTVSELIEVLQAIEADGYGDYACTVEGGCVGLDGIIEVWPNTKEVKLGTPPHPRPSPIHIIA